MKAGITFGKFKTHALRDRLKGIWLRFLEKKNKLGSGSAGGDAATTCPAPRGAPAEAGKAGSAIDEPPGAGC